MLLLAAVGVNSRTKNTALTQDSCDELFVREQLNAVQQRTSKYTWAPVLGSLGLLTRFKQRICKSLERIKNWTIFVQLVRLETQFDCMPASIKMLPQCCE